MMLNSILSYSHCRQVFLSSAGSNLGISSFVVLVEQLVSYASYANVVYRDGPLNL
jgi:hypothetical protein